MIDAIGTLLLLGLMLWVLHIMVSSLLGGAPSFKRYERAPTGILPVLAWIPVGYSLSKLLGTGVPYALVLVVSVLLAAVQRIFEEPFEIVIGGGGALVAVSAAVGGAACRQPLGAVGVLMLMAFAAVAVFLLVLSGDRFSTAAKLLAAVAAIVELVLLTVSPVGGTLLGSYGNAALVLPAGAAGVALLVGMRPDVGLAALGSGLLAGEAALAVAPAACDRSAVAALGGAVAFALARRFLSTRSHRQLVGVR